MSNDGPPLYLLLFKDYPSVLEVRFSSTDPFMVRIERFRSKEYSQSAFNGQGVRVSRSWRSMLAIMGACSFFR